MPTPREESPVYGGTLPPTTTQESVVTVPALNPAIEEETPAFAFTGFDLLGILVLLAVICITAGWYLAGAPRRDTQAVPGHDGRIG